MKLQYLGTAAAEGFPAVFCVCEKCMKAWKNGGRNIRSRPQAIIDANLLIDLGPDTFYHSIKYGINLADIRHCLITHTHRDHLYHQDLYSLRKTSSHPPLDQQLQVYGAPDVYAIVQPYTKLVPEYFVCNCVEPFVPFQAGNYTITALKAIHGSENPYIYSISDGKSNLLYAHDTDIFPEETWEYLKKAGTRFDLVSMDCTEGAKESLPYRGHMCLGSNRKCRQMLLQIGAADENTKFVLNHFSHNGLDACYEDFATLAEKEVFITSFDGMTLDF